ncbi:myb-like protein A isoform X2 [Zootermopsis nevadensis]|uniref:myb-like protein A isoform X2 n=1 Tax=Zootermopsis nevadensis TaxID=136037 RepID=UPI000B8E3A5E|nr:myb-like protein A isoform X2 [Zootermopsis nevadensis]
MVIILNSIMVMNTNRNNYKLDSPSYHKDLYNNSGSNNYHHYNNQQQQPSMNYNSWYCDNSTQHSVPQYEESQPGNKERSPPCCGCFPFESCVGSESAEHGSTPCNNDGSHSTSNGVYGTSASGDDDDDGFVPRSSGGYRYHHSVVNVTGNATSTNILRNTSSSGSDSGDRTCCVSSWCSGQRDATPGTTTTTEDSCCSGWCKPTILLLLLALLVVVFVLISGILLYFNYITYKPRPPIIEE